MKFSHGLTSSQRAMLELLKNGPHLAGHWDFSGSRVPDQLRKKGLVRRCEHPTVQDRRWHGPADAYELTDEGRSMLTSKE